MASKPAAAVRDIPLGALTMNTLKQWRGDRLPAPEALVFPTSAGTPQSAANISNRDWYPLLRTVGVKLRWHDLRHFCASAWIAQGFNAKTIMEWCGHSSIEMTFTTYGHLLPSEDHHQGVAEIEKRIFI